jgi:hypothetical protein
MTIHNLNRITPYHIAEYHNAKANTNKKYAELTSAEIEVAIAALQEDVQPNNLNTGLNFANLDEGVYNVPGQRWSESAFAFSTRWRGEDYSGYCVRVRRSSDDALLDIPFDPVTRNINIEALLGHVGSGNGYVHTWYNQGKTGLNAVQATNANQPQIVSNGMVYWFNGRLGIKFGSPTNLVVDTATNLGLESEDKDKTLFSTYVAETTGVDALISNYDSTPGTKQLSLWSNKFEVQSGTYLATATTNVPLRSILRHSYGVYYANDGNILLETATRGETVTKSIANAPSTGDFESTIEFYIGSAGDDTTAGNYLDGYLVEVAAWNQAIRYDFLVDN